MSAGRSTARGLTAATILALLVGLVGAARIASAATTRGRLMIPANADQLIVVSSPTTDPPAPGYLAALETYQRVRGSDRWQRVFGPWRAETGRGHLLPASVRREGDGATPVGVFGIGATIYGNRRNPGGLHYAYHQLACGDWWDEDPFSSQYNRFVHVACRATPPFASWSEALWTETVAYPYFAVLRFNMRPVRGGPTAPGAGIFLHSWVGAATAGCVALRESHLLRVLRWLEPSAHPVIEIGTDDQVRPRPAR